MTLISAVSFFDRTERWMGYAIASDDIIGVANAGSIDDIEERFTAEKCFYGKNFIGFFSGAIRPNETFPDHRNNMRTTLAALNNQFNDIHDHKQYNSLPILKNQPRDLAFLIASRRRAGRLVELFQLRQWPEEGWVARRLHVGSPATYKIEKTSTVWFNPFGDEDLEYVPIRLGEKLSPQNAQAMAATLILNPTTREAYREKLGYDIEKVNSYFISPVEHGRVEGRRLVPLK